MLGRLPVSVEPLRLAEAGAALEGSLPLRGMDRLLPLLYSDRGRVDARLRFAVDAAGRPTVSGHLKALVELLCQRCMTPMQAELEGELRLHIVSSLAEADLLDDPNDVLLVDGRPMKLIDILQDELILLLPLVPRHAPGECRGLSSADLRTEPAAAPDGAPRSGAVHVGNDAAAAQRPNPFAVLATMKRSGDG
jgi:uncharacterized protein